MTDRRHLRDLLEPETPRLSSDAARRLDARVAEALAARRPRPRAPILAGAPILVVLALLAWLAVRAPERGPEPLWLLDENEFVAALESWDGDLDEITYGGEDMVFDDESWEDADWQAFREILEDYDPLDTGGSS